MLEDPRTRFKRKGIAPGWVVRLQEQDAATPTPPTPPPNPPANATLVIDNATGEVSMSWDASVDATSYDYILRRISDGGVVASGSTTATLVRILPTLTAGETYVFSVTATGVGGTSDSTTSNTATYNPAPAVVWRTNLDGNGSVNLTPSGTLSAFVVGPNDSGGEGWSTIYAFFANPVTFTMNYSWSTTDGINYDWPFIFQTFSEPFNPVRPPFTSSRNTIVGNVNSETGSRTYSFSGNNYWLSVGVYSSDSCCGDGRITISGLPV